MAGHASPGRLFEPLTGRGWDRRPLAGARRRRRHYYASLGVGHHDRGFLLYGNTLEFFAERFGKTIDVCAFGYDNALLGQDVAVAIVLRASDPPVLRRLHDWTQRHLAQHQ